MKKNYIMLELNKIYNIDVIEGLKQLDDESIDIIITSPPYNIGGLNKSSSPHVNKWNSVISYGGKTDVDSMEEQEYQASQMEFLNECYRVLKKDGSFFYNHKNRMNKGRIITPYQWLLQSPFIIRQEIIWDRGSTHNVNKCRFLPTTEKIFWLTKTSKTKFSRERDAEYKTEVWSFPFETRTAHPAPFPLTLPMACLKGFEHNDNLTVLDPYMGSGTTALAAKRFGFNYIGFEIFPEYVEMANKRLNPIETQPTLFDVSELEEDNEKA